MVKQKTFAEETLDFTGGMVAGGMGLTFGSDIVAKLPVTPATAGVQSGFTTASGFMPVFGSIGGGGIALKQLKKLELKFK